MVSIFKERVDFVIQSPAAYSHPGTPSASITSPSIPLASPAAGGVSSTQQPPSGVILVDSGLSDVSHSNESGNTL